MTLLDLVASRLDNRGIDENLRNISLLKESYIPGPKVEEIVEEWRSQVCLTQAAISNNLN